MNIKRRLALAASLVGAAAPGTFLVPSSARAQTGAYPNRPIRMVVPFPAGGLTDVLMRGLGQELQGVWKQPIIIDNRPGANTIIAADYSAKQPPDGYTFLFANDTTVSANQYLYSKLPYDPVGDFVPVVNIAGTEELMVVRQDFPAKTLQEFIKEAKAKPGQLTYGSYGAGSKAHLDTEGFAILEGLKFNHIPYKGVSEVMVALSGGQIDFTLSGVAPVIQLAQSGKVRPVALAAPQRNPVFKDVPTFKESGVNYEAKAWFGLVAPKGTPDAINTQVASAISKIIRQPEFQQKFITGVGLIVIDQDPKQFAAFLEKDRREYEQLVKTMNIKLD